MREVGIVTDNAIDIDEVIAREFDIETAPITLITDEVPHSVTVDMDRPAFIDKLSQSKKFGTSGTNVQEYLDAYESVLKHAKSIISFGLATEVSVTYSSAVTAAELLDGANIKVYDSDGLYVQQGALALTCARKAQHGASFEEICAFIDKALPLADGYLISPNLAFIKAIGRVANDEGNEMRLAIVRVAGGRIAPVDAAADYDEGIEKVISILKSKIPKGQRVFGAYGEARNPEMLERLRKRVNETVGCKELMCIKESPIAAVVGGVGAVAFGWCPAI